MEGIDDYDDKLTIWKFKHFSIQWWENFVYQILKLHEKYKSNIFMSDRGESSPKLREGQQTDRAPKVELDVSVLKPHTSFLASC